MKKRGIWSWPCSSAQAISVSVMAHFVVLDRLSVRYDRGVQHRLVYKSAPPVSSASLMMPSMAGHCVRLGCLARFAKTFSSRSACLQVSDATFVNDVAYRSAAK
jgi:hypothetical protein